MSGQRRARSASRLLDAAALTPAEALEILSGLRLAAVCGICPGPDETVFARQVASLRSTESMVGQRANIAAPPPSATRFVRSWNSDTQACPKGEAAFKAGAVE